MAPKRPTVEDSRTPQAKPDSLQAPAQPKPAERPTVQKSSVDNQPCDIQENPAYCDDEPSPDQIAKVLRALRASKGTSPGSGAPLRVAPSHTFERKHTDAVIDVCIVNHLLEGFEVSYVLSASSDRLIRAWSLRAEQLRCVSKLRAHTAPVCVLLCAEKSGLLISASDDASVAFWKLDDVLAESSGETVVRPWLRKSIHHGPVRHLATEATHKLVISGSLDERCVVWSIQADSVGEALYVFDGQKSYINKVALTTSADKQSFFWASAAGDGKLSLSEMYLMRFHSSTQLHTKRTKMLDDHSDVSWVVLFADAAAEPLQGQQPLNCSGHTGKPAPLLLSASWDGSVRIWDTYTSECLGMLKGHSDGICALEEVCKQQVVSASFDKTMLVWSLRTKSCERALKSEHGHTSWVTLIRAVPPSRQFVLTIGFAENFVCMWDVMRGHCVRVFEGHTAPVRSLYINNVGAVMATGSDDGLVRVWNL